jgi:hypothetical protein
MNKRYAVGLVLAVILSVIGALTYLRQAPPPTVVQAMSCQDIVRGCSGAGLSVRMDRVPQIMRPFRVVVSGEGLDAVEASFQMAGMEMGFNRYRLQPRSDGSWDAEVTLPVCVRDRKDWLMLLDVRQGQERRQVAITFRTE